MIMSVGALLDESIYDILYDACEHLKKQFTFLLVQLLD